MALFTWFGKRSTDERRGPPSDLGRNDSCWCGSGRKYKQCHLEKDQERQSAALAAACRSGST